MRKGIILAGGIGSRLFPLTFSVTKQLLPVHDKPMIYYPLATLLELGVKEVLIICMQRDKDQFYNLFGDGSALGIKISYEIQNEPNGIAEGLIIAEQFLNSNPCIFILGDNLFVGNLDKVNLEKEINNLEGACIFTYKVSDPERYGVVELGENNKAINIIEKPKNPVSDNAITGIYFYDKNAAQIAKTLIPSNRGELEISDLNQHYLNHNLLSVKKLDSLVTWMDAGTIDSLYEASNFVSALEKRSGKKVACLEEISYLQGNLSLDNFSKLIKKYQASDYGNYLKKIELFYKHEKQTD